MGAGLPPKPAARRCCADLDAFEERAAIAEFDGGLPRAEAERLAAMDQGFTSAAALLAASMEIDR